MFLKEFIKDGTKQGLEDNVKNNQGEAIMINMNFVKNLGTNEAEYANSETNCENLCYSPLSDPQFIIPNFTALSFKSSTSINRGSAQFEVLDIEQCRGSIEEQITNFQQEMNKYEQKMKQGELEAAQKQIDCIPEEEEEIKEKQQKFQPVNFAQENQNKIIESFHPKYITHINLPECMRDFLITPFEQNALLQCLLIRDNSGLNMFTPKYKLLLGQNKQFLMSAKKILNKHKYIITQDVDFTRQERATILGKVEQSEQSQFDYYFFDDGVKEGSKSLFKTRKQLGGVFYNHNNAEKKPRNMTVLIKQKGDENNIVTFESRKPVLKKQFECNISHIIETIYTLDFYGRVKWPSVKNVQLVKRGENNDEIYFLLGKINSEQFNLDFKTPLSPLLAFQIALTAFDFQK